MKRFSFCLVFALFFTACASTPAAPGLPTATHPPAATVTPPPSTPMPATPTLAPTDAPLGVGTVAISASPTVAGPVHYGPSDFPANINPLTGLAVSDPSALNRRPLAIKVSQFPRVVRPQAGLSLADLVFEHYAEAGVTRMTAIFLSQDAPQVGSIRSARLIDIVLAESYGTMLVTSGSSAGTLQRLGRTNFYNRVIAEATGYDRCPPLCREGADPSTNNLFANTADIWREAQNLGLNTAQNLTGMAFDEAAPAGGTPINILHVDFQLNNNVLEWRYDAATGRYARWMDSDDIAQGGALVPHTDSVNGQLLTAANVVVLYANHVTTDIPEDYGAVSHCGYEIQLWSSGPAKVFRNGQMYEVTWVRFKQEAVIGLVGTDNQPFPLALGNTWFEIVNLNSPTKPGTPADVFSLRFKGPSQVDGCPPNFPQP